MRDVLALSLLAAYSAAGFTALVTGVVDCLGARSRWKVGIMLPIAETDSGTILRYGEIREAALQAERDQFDSVWIADHLLFEWDGQRRGIWEVWTVLSALAEATTRIELGTLVMCTAFRNPALLAKMADAVDEVSAGRLILGWARVGTSPNSRRLAIRSIIWPAASRTRCASSPPWSVATPSTTRERMNEPSTASACREVRVHTVRRS